jgi:hypothetical protein
MRMSLLDRAESRTDSPTTTTTMAAQRLRMTMAAVRVAFTWFADGLVLSLT